MRAVNQLAEAQMSQIMQVPSNGEMDEQSGARRTQNELIWPLPSIESEGER